MNNTTHRAFLRIGFDDILDDHIPTITLCLVKRTLKLLPRGNLVLLFYILSFIRLVLRSNQRGCHVYSENELSDSPVGDADPSGDEHCLGRTVSYTEKKDLRYTCLFHLPYEAAHYGIEEIAHFFFDSLFQLDATQYNAKQRNTLYSVFLVMVLNADFLFDTIARHLHEEPAHSSPPDPSSEQSVFASHLPSSTQYTILCNGSSRYYCCCFYSYHRYTFSSALTHPALTTPLPDSFRRDIDTSSTDEEREREEDVFIPVCFFVLPALSSPEPRGVRDRRGQRQRGARAVLVPAPGGRPAAHRLLRRRVLRLQRGVRRERPHPVGPDEQPFRSSSPITSSDWSSTAVRVAGRRVDRECAVAAAPRREGAFRLQPRAPPSRMVLRLSQR